MWELQHFVYEPLWVQLARWAWSSSRTVIRKMYFIHFLGVSCCKVQLNRTVSEFLQTFTMNGYLSLIVCAFIDPSSNGDHLGWRKQNCLGCLSKFVSRQFRDKAFHLPLTFSFKNDITAVGTFVSLQTFLEGLTLMIRVQKCIHMFYNCKSGTGDICIYIRLYLLSSDWLFFVSRPAALTSLKHDRLPANFSPVYVSAHQGKFRCAE